MKKPFTGLATLAAVVAVGAAVAVSASASPSKSQTIKAGGTYKVGWEQSFGFTDNFDPTGEYLGEAFSIYSNLLVRTLVGYNHVAGAAGNQLVPARYTPTRPGYPIPIKDPRTARALERRSEGGAAGSPR